MCCEHHRPVGAADQASELSRNDILQSLRSLDYDGSDRSVDCRIYRLRRKLGDLSASTERIKTIRSVGYLFSPTPW